MAAPRVAVVTGSNKGLGFATVRKLCKQFDGDVYLTARSEERGQEAVEKLKKEALNPKFHQLDIDDHTSIQGLHDFLKEKYGGLDLLINNAGVLYPDNSPESFAEKAVGTVKTNFWSTLDACETLFPLLRAHARVVNISSKACVTALNKMSAEKKAEVLAMKSMDEIKNMMTDFVESAKTGDYEKKGYNNNTAYGISKLGVTVMTIIQQAELDAQGKDDIVVNSACPGMTATDMTAFSTAEKRTPDEGAETPTYLALLAANVKEPRGKFVSEKQVVEWK